jgi:hypothetical protein
MIELLIKTFLMLSFFSVSYSQTNLSNYNLAELCNCEVSSTKSMFFSKKFLVQIDAATFNGLSNLQEIDLSFNDLTYIDKRTFNSLSNLQGLSLNYNLIKSINPEMLKWLVKYSKFRLFFQFTNRN